MSGNTSCPPNDSLVPPCGHPECHHKATRMAVARLRQETGLLCFPAGLFLSGFLPPAVNLMVGELGQTAPRPEDRKTQSQGPWVTAALVHPKATGRPHKDMGSSPPWLSACDGDPTPRHSSPPTVPRACPPSHPDHCSAGFSKCSLL